MTLANAGYLLGWCVAKLAGEFASGEPDEFDRIAPQGVLGEGPAYTDLIVRVRKDSHQTHGTQSNAKSGPPLR